MRAIIQFNDGFHRKITPVNDDKIAMPLGNLTKQRKPFSALYLWTDLNDINQPDLSHDKQRAAGESSVKLSEKNAFPIC